MDAARIAKDFFDAYTRALLDRDAHAVADLYAVPALIESPDQPLPVSDRAQTEAFFGAAFEQYDGVSSARTTIDVRAEAGHSIWADVTWDYGDAALDERFVYQLVRGDGVWRIAVLTPLEV